MKTAVTITRRRVDVGELRAEARAFEQAHPGFGRGNYVDAFRDEQGELHETDEFFRAVRLFQMLKHAEAAE